MAAERKTGEEVTHFIDPSTVAKATGGLSVQESYAQAGLGTALAVNDRIAGWQLLHAALADGRSARTTCSWPSGASGPPTVALGFTF